MHLGEFEFDKDDVEKSLRVILALSIIPAICLCMMAYELVTNGLFHLIQ